MSTKPRKAPTKPDVWTTLNRLIRAYAEAVVAASWAGGGDPADTPALIAQLDLQRALLNAHIEKMRREFEP